jgi:hypothetical protein
VSEIIAYDERGIWPEEIRTLVDIFEGDVKENGLESALKNAPYIFRCEIILPLPDTEISKKTVEQNPKLLELKYFAKLLEGGKDFIVLRESSIDHYKLVQGYEKTQLDLPKDKPGASIGTLIPNVTMIDSDMSIKDFINYKSNVASGPILLVNNRPKNGEATLTLVTAVITPQKVVYHSEVPFDWYPKKTYTHEVTGVPAEKKLDSAAV